MSEHRPFALAGARLQYGPDKVVAVLHIDLHLRPDLAAKTLHGVCTTTVEAIEAGVASVRLDAVDLLIESVTRDGQALPFRSTSNALAIEFPQPLRAGERAAFVVTYSTHEPRRGLYFVDEPRHAWTQSQDQDARFWFPCFDYPAEKQTTSATIVVPKGLFALSNGALVSRADVGETTVFRYEQSIPHATYLVTMVAGDFAEIEQKHRRVPVWYYTLRGREADGERAFGNTPAMIDTFEKAIGVPYAYERYSQIAVGDFIFGGMENTTATTQTDRTLHDERAHLDFSSDPLVSHELAHQWFGDLVTCRDWSQAWLNEGFATYFETVWREANLGWDEYQYDIYVLVQQYLDEDGDRYRRPIVCNMFRDPIELFDAHLYQKGGAVLHMLRGELGWERMQRALKRYVGDNAQRNVETIDLVRAIEASTGRNMRGFFDQWIERGGHPELEAGYRFDAERKTAYVTIEQKQTIDDDHPAYAFDIDLGFVTAVPASIARDAGDGPLPGEHRVRLRVEHKSERFAIPLSDAPALVRVDPGAYVLSTLKYGFDADMNAAILRADPSPVARIRAAKALSKDGSRVAREALANALGGDPFWGVAVEVAALLGSMRSPAGRAALLAAAAHPHPKVRRAVADALGNYRDADVASALLARRDDASYFVVSAAYAALGKTRDSRALDALVAGLAVTSWNDTIAAGAARGLGELADERALAPLIAAMDSACGEGLRRAAVLAIARLGALTDLARTRAVDALERAFMDPAYLVRVSTYAACETLADPRLLGSLDRMSATESDGRLRRDAAEAAIRVREARTVPSEVTAMREELEKLRAESSTLRQRLDELQKA
ncbi:MAG: M1 family metallopeptidase [Candidatus Velthaea sp.]